MTTRSVSAELDADIEIIIAPSKSTIILLVGISVIVAVAIIIGAYISSTAFQARQARKRNTIPVPANNATTVLQSEPFKNVYLRTVSGFWSDMNGSVVFESQPQQTWSYNGYYIVNDVTKFNLKVVGDTVVLDKLPSGFKSQKGDFIWVRQGNNIKLARDSTQTEFTLIIDNGQLRVTQATSGTVPDNSQVTLYQK